MSKPHVIRVEGVRVDPLESRAEGLVVRPEADGNVTRCMHSVPCEPGVTSGEAETALLEKAGD